MNPEEENKFKIMSYDPKSGASYHGTTTMNSDVYAYAELKGNQIIIKVVNESNKVIFTNYNTDQFLLLKNENQSFILNKGKITDYPTKSQIEPKSSNEYFLTLPSDFWKTVGMKDANAEDADYHDEFWTGLNQIQLAKKDIKLIQILLGGETTLILKPVPTNEQPH